MTEEIEEDIPLFIRELEIREKDRFAEQFMLTAHSAKEIEKKLSLGQAPTTAQINNELARVAKAADSFRDKLNSLNSGVLSKLDAKHINDGFRLGDKRPFAQIVGEAIDLFCTYCEQAKQPNKKTKHYTNLECLIADDFEECGGKIKVSDNGTFAQVLKVFRDYCKIRELNRVHVGKVHIKRIQSRRKKGLHLPG